MDTDEFSEMAWDIIVRSARISDTLKAELGMMSNKYNSEYEWLQGVRNHLKEIINAPEEYVDYWNLQEPGEMRTAMASARQADKFKCDCWNTKCPNFGDCRKCLVYEMCLKQLPTCQRDLLEELQQHYNSHSGDK